MPDPAPRAGAAAGPAARPEGRPSRRGFNPLRDLPALVWLILLVAAAILHRGLPLPGWLLLHLLFLGAITHSILVWSQRFALALTRTRQTPAEQRGQAVRLGLANLGTVLVLVGVPAALWPLTIAGTALLVAAVAWHGASIWLRARRALPGRFTRTLRYYVASAACLPVGAAIGAWLAGPGDSSGRLVLAHAIVNVLGWIGITVAGTLVTLWPTMLRTRADERAAQHSAVALPVLGGAVLVAAVGTALGSLPVLVAGLAGYAAGLGVIGVALVTAARSAPPRSFATLSAGSALLWWIGCVAALAAQAVSAWASGAGFDPVLRAIDGVAPYLAAGFAAQVLIGALSYLAPVAIGGGPAPVRVGTAMLDRLGPLRVATANVALLVCALPVSSLMRVAASVLYLVAMASFLPLFIASLRVQSRTKRAGGLAGSAPTASTADPAPANAGPAGSGPAAIGPAVDTPATQPRRGPIVPEGEHPRGRRAGQAVAGLLVVTLVTAAFAALEPQSIGRFGEAVGAQSSEAGDANAPVQTVTVTAADMRFTPSRIEVPVGTRLVIELVNADESQVHDLVLAGGARSSRLAPGSSETIDAGVIRADVAGWCSIAGHRQMGMTLDIVAVGATGSGAAGHEGHGSGGAPGSSSPAGESAASLIDLAREPGPFFAARDAALAPLPPASGPVTHRIELPVTELATEVAPGVRQRLWTFGGSAPGPVLHGRVGDTFEVTLVNDGTIGHSIDFHAGALAPDEPMRTIAPGESLTYTFTATRSGIWMYHCSTMPMSAHIANGMYGAVVIEPAELPAVDRSYVLVQGEYYLGPQDGEVDADRLAAERPDLVVFNGYAAQYDHAPLAARVGERVRVWVLDAGPNRATSFHVVGGQFDTVWSEGRYLVNRAADTGSQALALQPAQGGFVELVFPEAGGYPFVSHIMVDAERGAHGFFQVTP